VAASPVLRRAMPTPMCERDHREITRDATALIYRVLMLCGRCIEQFLYFNSAPALAYMF
jgi:hypothetical protein